MSDVGHGEDGAQSPALEFLRSEDLAALLVRKWKLSVAETADIMVPVISALAAAHDVGTIHGDLNPQSIMLVQRDHGLVPRLVGFGGAKSVDASVHLTGLQAPLGARMYLSPEQASGSREIDARSDQFALGVVLYQCLVGQPPFEAGTVSDVIAQVVACTYTKPRAIEPSIPRAVEAIIERALRRRPEDRFASMRDLGAAFLPFASEPVQRSYVAELGPSIAAGRSKARSLAEAEDSAAAAEAPQSTASGLQPRVMPPRRRGALVVIVAALSVLALLVLGARRSERAAVASSTPASDAPSEPGRAPEVQVPDVPSRPPSTAPSATAATRAPAAPTPTPASKKTYRIALTVEPESAWIMLDGKAAGSGRLQRELPLDGKPHALHVGAPGYRVRALHFQDAPPPVSSVVLEKRSAPSKHRPRSEGARTSPAEPTTF